MCSLDGGVTLLALGLALDLFGVCLGSLVEVLILAKRIYKLIRKGCRCTDPETLLSDCEV